MAEPGQDGVDFTLSSRVMTNSFDGAPLGSVLSL